MKAFLTLFLLVGLCSGSAWAQATAGGGAVTGTVRDPYGDGIPDTTVVLTNPSLNLRRTMNTTDDGMFDAPALAPAAGYRLRVTRKGFVDWESGSFQVQLGRTLNFNIDMKVEGPPTHVEPGAVLAPVDDTQSGVASSMTTGQLDSLPTRERRLDDLVLQAPAVTLDAALSVVAFRGEPSTNSFLTDGLATTNTYSADRPGIANHLMQDTAQEFQVLSGDYPAEFGGAMGGIVNAVTRNAATAYHGAAYDYYRNHGLSAADRFALGQNLFQKQNQAGANIGGPVWRNRIFFFGNVDVLDGHFDDLNRITSPLIADPTGTAVLASDCKATSAQCAAAIKFIEPQMDVETPLSQRWVTGLAKVDYRRSDRNNFSAEFNALNSRFPGAAQTQAVAPNGGLLGIGDSHEDTRFGRGNWTFSVTPSAVNELRAGLYEDRFSDPASQSDLSTGNLSINLAGAVIGASRPYSSLFNERRRELVDNFTLTSNSHSFKFGVDGSTNRDAIAELQDATGTYFYPSLTTFAQDFTTVNQRDYTMFTQTFGNPDRAMTAKQLNVYAQDTWKVTRNLTLSYGLRWEKSLLPQPSIVTPPYYNTGTIPSRNLNFAPRFNAAYMTDDRTVVRVSFGFFYAPQPGELLDALLLGNGQYQTSVVVNPIQSGSPVFPKVFASASSVPGGSANVEYALSKWRNPYTQQSSVAVERSLTQGTTVTLSLMHVRGLYLSTVEDVNLLAPAKTETYTIDNAAGASTGSFTTPVWSGKNDGSHAHVYQVESGGSSWYNAAALQFRQRLWHDLSVQAAYTYSQAIDNVGGPPVAGGVPLNVTSGDLGADKGLSAANQRHRAAFNWTWQPRLGSGPAAARYAVNGWELSAIAVLASPQPATSVAIVSGQQFSGVTMAFTNSLNGSGGWSRVPFSSVSDLRMGDQRNLDVRLARTVPFRERIKGTLMFEVFNVTNTQYITGVNTVAYTATAGVIRPVAGLGLGIASQSYPYGTNARSGQVAFRVVF